MTQTQKTLGAFIAVSFPVDNHDWEQLLNGDEEHLASMQEALEHATCKGEIALLNTYTEAGITDVLLMRRY